MRWLVALALVLAQISAAHAISNQVSAGYYYPSVISTTDNVTSAQVDWTVAAATYSGSGHTELAFQWLGITGSQTLGNNCPGISCLGQFGTASQTTTGSVKTYQAWWELFCVSNLAPCNNIQFLSTTIYPVSPGDHMVANMTCVSNCTADNASQEWALSLQDITQGWTWTNGSPVCTTGAETSCFNWPLGLGQTDAVIENGSSASSEVGPNIGTAAFWNFQAGIGGGSLGQIPLDYGTMAAFATITAGGATRTMAPSAPYVNDAAFHVCYSTSATLPSCPNAQYTGTDPVETGP